MYIGSYNVCRYVCMRCVHVFSGCVYGVCFLSHTLHCFPVLSSNCLSHKLAGAIYCDRALRINGFTGEGVQSGTVLIVKAHSVTPRWRTTKTIDFDSKVTLLVSLLL